MVAQVFDYLICFALRSHSGDFASLEPFGIYRKILLGVAIQGDFVIMLHHQQGGGGEDFALAVVDNRAHVIHSRGVSRAAYRFGVQRAIDVFHIHFSFSLGWAYHRFPYLNYITYYNRQGRGCQPLSAIFFYRLRRISIRRSALYAILWVFAVHSLRLRCSSSNKIALGQVAQLDLGTP